MIAMDAHQRARDLHHQQDDTETVTSDTHQHLSVMDVQQEVIISTTSIIPQHQPAPVTVSRRPCLIPILLVLCSLVAYLLIINVRSRRMRCVALR